MTTATPAPGRVDRRHRATSWDRWAVIGLGAAGSALSYDALSQMAIAVHTRHPLTYLFPVVIDGFIAYGIRALLVLRNAPLRARLYAWGLFIAATAASIWANCLHAVDLNQPGTVALHLDNTTVAVLSAIAPLALAGATHLHILINRYGTSTSTASHCPSPTASTTAEAEIPYRTEPRTAAPAEIAYESTAGLLSAEDPDPESVTRHPVEGPREEQPDETASGTEAAARHDPVQQPAPTLPEADTAGHGPDESSGHGPKPKPGGRPALASLDQLADLIGAAFPDVRTLTREGARKAIADAGLGAGTVRLTEAMAIVRQRAGAQQHPVQD